MIKGGGQCDTEFLYISESDVSSREDLAYCGIMRAVNHGCDVSGLNYYYASSAASNTSMSVQDCFAIANGEMEGVIPLNL